MICSDCVDMSKKMYKTLGNISDVPIERHLLCPDCDCPAVTSECGDCEVVDEIICDCVPNRHTCSNGHVWIAEEDLVEDLL